MELVDFSAGFPSVDSIKNAGFGGVIPYFSDPRDAWMKAKPATRDFVQECLAKGLVIVPNYQYGKGTTSDWYGGYDGGARCAERMLRIMDDCGLSGMECAKYGPVDSNPTLADFNKYIGPFFKGWESQVGHAKSGAYANTWVIEWLLEDGYCSYFWQHGWDGRAAGVPLTANPSAHILQYEIDKSKVDGIGIDRNRTLQADFGQVAPARGDDDVADTLRQFMGPVIQ